MAADYIDGRPLTETEKQQISEWLSNAYPTISTYEFSDYCRRFSGSKHPLSDEGLAKLQKMEYWERWREIDMHIDEYFWAIREARDYFPTVSSFCVADQALIDNYIEIGEWDEHDAPKIGELVYDDGGQVWAGRKQVEQWDRTNEPGSPFKYITSVVLEII